VGRDDVLEIVTALGAQAVALARSDTFIPVDTEAVRPVDQNWPASGPPSSASTRSSRPTGFDRPLLADETGQWLRGDVLGVLCAQALGILRWRPGRLQFRARTLGPVQPGRAHGSARPS
jgi:phosphomannomutase